MSVDVEWRWSDPNGQQRAVRTDELRAALSSGVIAPNTLVWKRGWAEWKPAYDVPELTTSALASANGVIQNIPPPPLFMVAVQHEYEDRSVPSSTRENRAKASPPVASDEPPPPPKYAPAPVRSPASPRVHTMPLPTLAFPKNASSSGALNKASDSSQNPVSKAKASPNRTSVTPTPRPAASLQHSARSPVASVDSQTGPHSSTVPGAPPPPHSSSPSPPFGPRGDWDEIEPPLVARGAVPPARPSETQANPPIRVMPEVEANTAVDATALSPADAERVLAHHAGSAVPEAAHSSPINLPPPPSRRLATPSIKSGAFSSALPTPHAPPVATEVHHTPRMPIGLPSAPSLSQPSPVVAPVRSVADSVQEISDEMLLPADSDLALTQERGRMVELSSSALLPDGSGPTGMFPSDDSSPFPSMNDRSRLEQTGATRIRAAGRRAFYNVMTALRGPRQKWVVAALAALGVVLLVGFIALLASLAGNKAGDKDNAARPTATGLSMPALGSAANATAPHSQSACAVAGPARIIAARAIVPSGVEAAAAGGKLGLGFATTPKDAVVVQLDPASLAVVGTSKAHVHETIRRVVPLLGAARLDVGVDVDRKGGSLARGRMIGGEDPFFVGESSGQLAWAMTPSEPPRSIVPLDGDADVDALRGVELSSKGYALAFRHGATIGIAALHADKTLDGSVVKVSGLGPQVGSPTLAASGDVVLVAWADRASATDPWSVRWVKYVPGVTSVEPQAFTLPAGGLGEQAMSPGVAALPDGRFLIAWTEGPVASHQVRAQTLSMTGQAIGEPMTISEEGMNAGQGQVAIANDGRGVIAFLASNGTGFQVVATPIVCARAGAP